MKTLTLTSEQEHWLKPYLQNPLSEEESFEDSQVRREIFESLAWPDRRPPPPAPALNSEVGLGETYEDCITGFTGVAVGYVQYLTGCNQALLVPRGIDLGKRPEASGSMSSGCCRPRRPE